MGNTTQCGARKSFLSVKNKPPFSPSVVHPIAIVNDVLAPKLRIFLLYVMNVCHRQQKYGNEATQKDVFHFILWHEYFACCFLILRSSGKCTLCCSINTTLEGTVARRAPASLSFLPPPSLVLVRHLASTNRGSWHDRPRVKLFLRSRWWVFKNSPTVSPYLW